MTHKERLTQLIAAIADEWDAESITPIQYSDSWEEYVAKRLLEEMTPVWKDTTELPNPWGRGFYCTLPPMMVRPVTVGKSTARIGETWHGKEWRCRRG